MCRRPLPDPFPAGGLTAVPLRSLQFLIEGLFTLLSESLPLAACLHLQPADAVPSPPPAVGIASFWMMPSAPTRTVTRFRPKGYLTDHDAKIIVNRAIRDDPGKGGMHNRQALTFKMIGQSLADYDLWPLYFIGLVCVL